MFIIIRGWEGWRREKRSIKIDKIELDRKIGSSAFGTEQ